MPPPVPLMLHMEVGTPLSLKLTFIYVLLGFGTQSLKDTKQALLHSSPSAHWHSLQHTYFMDIFPKDPPSPRGKALHFHILQTPQFSDSGKLPHLYIYKSTEVIQIVLLILLSPYWQSKHFKPSFVLYIVMTNFSSPPARVKYG